MTRLLTPDTLAIHADEGIEPAPDVAPPIHVSTTFDAENPAGLLYSRFDQPTRQRFEAVLGALEGGEAVTYASGLAAVTAAVSVLRPRRVAIARGGYFGCQAAIDAFAVGALEGAARRAPRAGRPRLDRDAAQPHLRAAGQTRPRSAGSSRSSSGAGGWTRRRRPRCCGSRGLEDARDLEADLLSALDATHPA